MVASDGIVLLRGGPRCVWILRARNHLSPNMVSTPDLEQESKATAKGGLFRILIAGQSQKRSPKKCPHYYITTAFPRRGGARNFSERSRYRSEIS